MSHYYILSYNGKDYSDHPSAVNDHSDITLGNLDNNVLAVGDESSLLFLLVRAFILINEY